MSETATYKTNTFAGLEETLNALEQDQPQEPPPTAPIEEAAKPETPSEAPVETPTQQPEAPKQEDNVSNFTFDIEGIEVKPSLEPEQPKIFNLDEELKKADRKEVLKKLGVNDFALEIDEYLSKGGKAADYLSAKAIDYNQISDEELIKEDLRKQYPAFDKEKINRLFEMNYGASELDTDAEKENKALKLEADAYVKRQSKIAEQQKFVIPETPILPKDEAYENWKKQQDSQPQLMEQLRNYYATHEATKALNESKRVAVSLGEGVAPFNFSIERPDLITKMWTDGGELAQKLMTTKTGEPDVAKQHLIALFSFNPQRFIQDIFAYGQKMGVRKELVEEGQNGAVKPQAKVLPVDQNQKPTYSAGKYADRQR